MLEKADILEEYIVSVGISFGLRVGDFLRLTRGQLEPLLDKEVPIQVPEIQTQKKGETAYPFIDGDAQKAIKQMLLQMDREGRTGNDELMLVFNDTKQRPDNAVNVILQDLAKKANIPLGNYRIRFHCLRKFLTDRLSSVCSGDKWRFFVGKSANGTPYVSSEGRDAYKAVLKYTQIASGLTNSAIQQKLENTIKQLEKENSANRTRIELMQKHHKEEIQNLTEKLNDIEKWKETIDAIVKANKTLSEKE
jgi:hypothetical protein